MGGCAGCEDDRTYGSTHYLGDVWPLLPSYASVLLSERSSPNPGRRAAATNGTCGIKMEAGTG